MNCFCNGIGSVRHNLLFFSYRVCDRWLCEVSEKASPFQRLSSFLRSNIVFLEVVFFLHKLAHFR